MGRAAIILVFCLLIIVGTISVFLFQKQVEAVDRVATLTSEKQSRNLANSFARIGLRELRDTLNRELAGSPIGSMTDEEFNALNARYVNFAGAETIPNSQVTVEIIRGEFERRNPTTGLMETVALDTNEFFVVSTARVRTANETTYIARANVFFVWGAPSIEEDEPYIPPPPPPVLASSDWLTFALRTNSVLASFPNAGNDTHNTFQFFPGQQNHWDTVTSETLAQFNYVYRLRSDVPRQGAVTEPIRIVNYQTGANATPEIPTYKLTIISLGYPDGSPKNVRLDASLFSGYSTPRNPDDLRLFIHGDVIIDAGSGGQRPDLAQRRIHANIYLTGTVRNWSSIPTANKSGTHQHFLTVADLITQINEYNLEDDPDDPPTHPCGCPLNCVHCGDGSGCVLVCVCAETDVPGNIRGIRAWIELPTCVHPAGTNTCTICENM
jgi:hypothetical protein